MQAAQMAAIDAIKEGEELRKMVLEERRSWDAHELNVRNRARMIEQVRQLLLIDTNKNASSAVTLRISSTNSNFASRVVVGDCCVACQYLF